MVPPPARTRSERSRALRLSAMAEGFADAHRRNAADLQAVFAPLPDEEATVLHERGRRIERDRAAGARRPPRRRPEHAAAGTSAHSPSRRIVGFALFTATLAARFWIKAPIETQASEWRNLTLNDGSFVSVGPHTQLRDRFGERQRLLSLASGEALFQVAKDPSRPFIVDAGYAVVRATGTRFAVSRREHDVIVTVEEGTVLVSRGGEIGRARAERSGAGHGVRYVATSSRHVNAERELAWSRANSSSRMRPSRPRRQEFNRRNRVQIVVDPALGSEQVRGVFQLTTRRRSPRSIAVARKAPSSGSPAT